MVRFYDDKLNHNSRYHRKRSDRCLFDESKYEKRLDID